MAKKYNIQPNGFARLSKREMLVFTMLIQEFKNSEIASTLKLSEKTICTYKTRILKKTCCKTIIGLYLFNETHKIVAM